MFRLADREFDLSIIYDYQYVHNDIYYDNNGDNPSSYYQIAHTPILKASTTGVIYVSDRAVQTFIHTEEGALVFTNIGNPDVFAMPSSNLDCKTGNLAIVWNKAPGLNHVVLNYEYLPESQPLSMHQSFPQDDEYSIHQY